MKDIYKSFENKSIFCKILPSIKETFVKKTESAKMHQSMKSKLLDGKLVSQKIWQSLQAEITALKLKTNWVPGLAFIIVGNHPPSVAYVNMKKKACDQIGIRYFEWALSETTSQSEIEALIRELNNRSDIHGILVQVPLPKSLNEDAILSIIDPTKDVDGFHPVNIGNLLLGLDCLKSCTPLGVMTLCQHYGIDFAGKRTVLVGRSNIVGKPLAAMLIQRDVNATLTICHSRTPNLDTITSEADILIAAIGQPKFIKANFVKPGAVIIDVGTNRIDDPASPKGSRLVGDVDFDDVLPKVSKITPSPGGIGPMTIAMLMQNTVQAFKTRL